MTVTPHPDDARPGDGLVKAGGIVFALGAVATLVTMAPLFLGTDPFPSYAWAVCMLMGVGFAISAAGVLRSAAAQRKAARASQAA
ncbi:hypothetical protein ACFXJO_30910 [Streptomyces lavendulae]|uniref:Uncharacterized protein n=1 Tax=Streptomyces lavendulae subsp. lavendulae TaxID=58340 RepID=A0A2K8PHS9_STRLA|nr:MULTISPECIES: hypothetical protein [Streptomyces]GLX39914.1 hypothetical protein Sros01_59870 [Streptomyces roseochromogenus]ATZ25323.1 hypothetical protein SLAV_17365 [Streptomyces lavendulae subsp. lavendulae]MDH6542453.1 hypothetical protein [Streptomyces sp. SPB4]QUQ55153.1 hypothetical protein SLLC_15435 [Streptomyces lavendulae subsp. lavendulae]GLV81905.1 hypothetical protein Slala03_15940 [Streptomyces lavendulae subsp. lavendulae]